jgi:hypothetical protein
MSRTITMLAALAFVLAGTGRVGAEVIITFSQQGPNVVATSNGGSLNLKELTDKGPAPISDGPGLLNPAASIAIGNALTVPPNFSAGELFGNILGPANFGSGGAAGATSASGTGPLGVLLGTFNELVVPVGFTGGSLPIVSSTWDNTTINGPGGLGLTPGTYEWQWGNEVGPDDLKIVIPAPPTPSVPEPASLTLLGIGAVGMMGYAWRRWKVAVA